jgi:hypothetical protein
LLAQLLVVYGREGLSATQALSLNVSVSDSSVERVQLSEQPIARFNELALAAQLV